MTTSEALEALGVATHKDGELRSLVRVKHDALDAVDRRYRDNHDEAERARWLAALGFSEAAIRGEPLSPEQQQALQGFTDRILDDLAAQRTP